MKKILITLITLNLILATLTLNQFLIITYMNSQQHQAALIKSYLMDNYGVSSIDELIQKKLEEYGSRYTGNPFTTALYPGQIQAENITFMHGYWYNPATAQSENKTDIWAYPEQTATFIIFKDSAGNVCAKNTTSGQIQFGGAWDAGGVDGADAAAVIRNTIVATSSGDIICIKPGVVISSTITIDKSIVFEGFLTVSGAIYGFDAQNGSITFRNFNYSATGGYGVLVTGAEELTLENCILNVNFYAVRVNTPDDLVLKISHCKIRLAAAPETAVSITNIGSESEIYIYNSDIEGGVHKSINLPFKVLTLENNVFRNNRYSIRLHDIEHVNIIGNVFIDCASLTGAYQGVLVYSNSGTTYTLNIIGNTIYFSNSFTAANTLNGIVISGEASETPIVSAIVANNYLFSTLSEGVPKTNIHTGIYLHGNSSTARNVKAVVVEGNYVYGFKRGIVFTYTTESKAIGNTVRYVGESGIILCCATGCVVTSNTISNYDLLNTGKPAIEFIDFWTGTVIRDNFGFATESSGIATVANGEYIAHGIDSSLNIGQSNSSVLITEYTKIYDGVPVTVGCDFVNATHFRVAVYWTNGTAITDDAIQIWWRVEYAG